MTSVLLQDDFRMTQRALSKHSESNQREREQSDFVIPSEPKIIRLVFVCFTPPSVKFSHFLLAAKTQLYKSVLS